MGASSTGFSSFELRALDVPRAAAFYARVAGLVVTEERAADLELVDVAGLPWGAVVPLPPAARALGAPPHWLGHVAANVDDAGLEAAVARLVAIGAARLGPTRRGPDGRTIAGLRDPSGAPFALTGAATSQGLPPVGWHELHAADAGVALAFYAALGWRPGAYVVPPATADAGRGGYVPIVWDEAAPRAAVVESVRPGAGVHPHWLFAFDVPDLDRALAAVVAEGGHVIRPPARHPSGTLLAPCEDVEGAAFALRAAAPGALAAVSRRP